jgi:thiamine-phosphate pyrophosphorylase
MTCRQPRITRKKKLPKIWLMTDARFGDELIPAIRRLPSGSGVIFRHYHLPHVERRKLFGKVRRVCSQRGHSLFLAGSERLALRWHADGFHQRGESARSRLLQSAPVHNRIELREARRNRADLVFISPVFPTRSHPGAKALGLLALNRLARQAGSAAVVALGGMTQTKARALNPSTTHGWAAIDAFR